MENKDCVCCIKVVRFLPGFYGPQGLYSSTAEGRGGLNLKFLKCINSIHAQQLVACGELKVYTLH
jgi:hypothetical protein